MTTSAQLERDAERTRAQIAETIDELRGRMTPGHMVDQLVNYARESSGGQFANNLKHQVVNNPMPIALIGAGLAWMMISGRSNGHFSGSIRRSSSSAADHGDTTAGVGQSIHDTASEWSDRAGSAAHSMGERARETGARMSDAASGAFSSASDAANSAYEATAEGASRAAAAIGNTASSLRSNASSASHNLRDFLKEQPLMVVGIGIALGALLGAALPSTETEDRLMGDKSDELKDDAQRFAQDQYEKGKTVAERAYAAGEKSAEEQGLALGDGGETPSGQQRTAESSSSSSGEERWRSDQSTALVPDSEEPWPEEKTKVSAHGGRT